MTSPQGPRTGAMTSPASSSFSSHWVVLSLGIVKTIAGLLGLFYLNGRSTMCSQDAREMIAKGKRYKQHAGRKIRPYPGWNDCIPLGGGQLDRPPRVHADDVGILLAHFNEAVGEELSL